MSARRVTALILSLAIGALGTFGAVGAVGAELASSGSADTVGLQADGSTGAAAASALLKRGSRGPAVRSMQRRLVTLTYLPRGAADGIFGIRTWHAVVAFQGWSRLVRDGVVGPRTQRALARARVPRPWSTATGMEVHLAQQVLLLVRDGRVQRAIHVSTGRPGYPTPSGHFRIQSRYTMSWSVRFRVWMPLAQYFVAGYALHEYPDVPAYPASHGCIRVPAAESRAAWSFGAVGMRFWTAR